MFTTLALLAGLVSTPAEAGVYVSIGIPAVHVAVDPWSPAYVPAPRAGYTWAAGYYDGIGVWHPGHWVPVHARAGYAWVAGYWVGAVYHDGYWRPAARSGYAWVDGYYSHGRWIDGYWRHAAYVRHEVHEHRTESSRYYHSNHHEPSESHHAEANPSHADTNTDPGQGPRGQHKPD